MRWVQKLHHPINFSERNKSLDHFTPSEHLNIHIYGACGAPCPGSSTDQCLQYLSKWPVILLWVDCNNYNCRFYKFVLVFEPYMCQHFVSDLIWAVLSTDMVPVVFGKEIWLVCTHDILTSLRVSGGVSYSKLLPRGSYIDALNQSPKNLAHFLRWSWDCLVIIGKYNSGIWIEVMSCTQAICSGKILTG